MKKIKQILLILLVMILIVAISGGVNFYLNFANQEFTIDPEIKINPNQVYEVTYWDYPLYFGKEKEYKSFLEEKIIEFERKYPNIKVNYKLLSPSKGRSQLKEQLDLGTPPDIYNAIWGTRLTGSKLQIPVNLLLEDQAIKQYCDLGIESFKNKKNIWGLPQFLMPQVWVANKKNLEKTNLKVAKVQREGWNWREFNKVAREINDSGREKCIIFNADNEQLLVQLLAAANEDFIVAGENSFNYDLNLVFQLLKDLRTQKVFPRSEKKMAKKMLPYFWQKKAGFIAPVNFWLLDSLYQQQQRYPEVELTLLPIPTYSDINELTPVKVTGLLLFRQQEYQGDDHTKAVYKFAQFMNQKQSIYIAKNLKVIPAYLPLQSKWDREVELKLELKKLLLNYSQQGKYLDYNYFSNSNLDLLIKEQY